MKASFDWEDSSFGLITDNISLLISLIRIATIHNIQIRLNVGDVGDEGTKENIDNWIRTGVALKNNKTVKKIFVNLKNTNYVPCRVLVDIISSKIKYIKVCKGQLGILAQSKIKFENLSMREHKDDLDYATLFKIKVKQITVQKNLIDLAKCGKLPVNHFIQKLKIRAQFSLKQPSEDNQLNNKSWESEYLPLCEKAFKVINNVNPNMILELAESKYCDTPNVDSIFIISKLREKIENAVKIIELAQSNGQQIKKIKIDGIYNIDENNDWDDFIENVTQRLGLDKFRAARYATF